MSLEDHILFVDADVILLDKPAGLPVDAPRKGGDSIEARIDELRLNYKRPPVAMHRLDQDTSGCLLFARHQPARRWFQQVFEQHLAEKSYVALVGGEVGEEEGVIELPLSKQSSAESGWKMVGDPDGKPARTRWRRLAVREDRSLVLFMPLTGRTHQIRVHAREGLGHGIIGDRVYGYPGGEMMLHAWKLTVPRKKGDPLEGVAPLPERFAEWKNDVAG
ncbi:RluA family pseudouridine synthase [Sphingomicrobium lutaoense]|uniref:tRNA pseudouridine32 synthase/23S rRNA pseudouridine746 synthase n=1 Tax=Sphingomicrobium lutaoense TaxID=515949 RepID=A0A839Z3X3_9SPHN|nr:RNA pseudouridine synthase [Sphingomicrobium lutaoense]MBB3764302.1 tRNA pseudouridine32 synthase/23S rRNA pseudouridine746 synthase [Sphingomicrobium lutaoense]